MTEEKKSEVLRQTLENLLVGWERCLVKENRVSLSHWVAHCSITEPGNKELKEEYLTVVWLGFRSFYTDNSQNGLPFVHSAAYYICNILGCPLNQHPRHENDLGQESGTWRTLTIKDTVRNSSVTKQADLLSSVQNTVFTIIK